MRNRHKNTIGMLWASIAFTSGITYAAPPIIYPANEQTAEQQQKDTHECTSWANNNAPMINQAPAPGGTRIRGAARGAVGGAVIGEIANDDASDGAAVGATAGILAGGARARKNRRAAAEAQKIEQENAYHRAFGACMEGKDYIVK